MERSYGSEVVVDDIVKQAKEQMEAAIDFERENRQKAVEDIEFVFAEDQWDEQVKKDRGNRPCLNANDLPIFLDKVSAAQRMNRTGIKVMPVDSFTDPIKAEMVGGLIRYIEHVSDAHVAYDMALENAAAGGYCGAIRIVTQYENDHIFTSDGEIKPEFDNFSAFNQEIRIVPVLNPLNVLFDPSAKLWHRNDGRFMFYMEDMLLEDFEAAYPEASVIDFETEELPDRESDWWNVTNKTVRVAEYFVKKKKGSKFIYLVINDKGDLEVSTKPPADKSQLIKKREIEDYDIVWYKISGREILEGPVKLPGKLWPIVPVWGKEYNVNGKHNLRGMFRYVKDPQRMYIYTQSAITEMLALQPKAPYIGTPRMFEGHEAKWRTANTANWPYLPTNIDERAPGLLPRREQPPPIPVGLVEQGQQRQVEKKDIIGLHEASLGVRSNETSGKAIRERRISDDATTYAYHDNLSRAIQQVGRVIEDMRPVIYDTPRVIKMLGMDGKTITSQKINQPYDENGEPREPVDFTVGQHDIVIQTGPSYATQRQEALDRLQNIMQYAPQIAPVIADVLVDYMDIPRGDKLVKRLESILPDNIKQMEQIEQGITKEQVQGMIQQAVEQFKGSIDGQVEMAKVEQQALKTQQQKLKLKQEQVKLAEEAAKLHSELGPTNG